MIWCKCQSKNTFKILKCKYWRTSLFGNYLWVWVWVNWCLTSHATIYQSYMWRHRCAGGRKRKLDLRSGSQRHRHLGGFFNMPGLHRHGTTLFIRRFRHIAPFSRLLRHAGDTEDVFSTLTPGVLTGVWNYLKRGENGTFSSTAYTKNWWMIFSFKYTTIPESRMLFWKVF